MAIKFTGLWRHPDFLKLWSGETISVFGSQITMLALPLTAVVILKSSPVEMGILNALAFAPFLLLSLFAGVWADRMRRRPILIIADLSRFVLLGSIPVVYLAGWLSIYYLYVVSLLIGVTTVFFDIAYQAYLPVLIDRDQLVEGNGKMEVSRSIAQVAGPGLAGILVQLISAPIAIVLDAISFLLSAAFVGAIKKAEPVKPRPADAKSIWHEIGEGWQVVASNPVLRSIAACTSTGNFFNNMMMAVYTLYVINSLKLSAGTLGLIFGIGGIGALIGAMLAGWIARRFGVGPTIISAAAFFGITTLLVPLASDNSFGTIALLAAAQFLISIGGPIYDINQVSLRQAITPERLQGRMNASMRFIVWGTIPLGALTGGLLGAAIGLQTTLWVGAVGSAFSFLFVLFSPLRALREQPTFIPEEELLSV